MQEKSILFTGGGTAGHVIVNLALIPYFHEQGWKISYIGSKDGIERELVGDIPYVDYYPISTGKLRRYMSIENFKDPFKVLKGIADAARVIRKTKPQIIFSKGGFVSVPVVIAAKLKRVPTIIHESDLTPGLANKLASPFAKKVLTTFPETVKYIKGDKAKHVGAVVREHLFTGTRSSGYELTGFNEGKTTLLIMGGSIGSQKINDIIRENLDILLKTYQIVHICGKGNVDETFKRAGYVQYEYVRDELSDLFAITDIVLSRAGSNAIFEFLALNIPMLLIPLSLAASRGDQIDNAKSFERQGYAHVLFEENMTDSTLLQAITRLTEEAETLKENLQVENSEVARREVIQLIESMAKK